MAFCLLSYLNQGFHLWSMRVELSGIDEKGLAFSFEAGSGDIDLGEEPARVKGALNISGTVVPGARVEVKGRVEGLLELDCTRCLRPIESRLDLEFDDLFVDVGVLMAAPEGELAASDLATDALTGSEIDLMELAREQVLLSVPEQIFCKDDCKGLCDRCGANLNDGDCGCAEGEEDPRWSALKNLK